MSLRQAFPVFSISFAIAYPIIYVLVVEYNWALFTYGPATGQLGLLRTPAAVGPTMYWYGWIATAALGGATVAALAALVPAGISRHIRPELAWIMPMITLLVLCGLLRGYFLR